MNAVAVQTSATPAVLFAEEDGVGEMALFLHGTAANHQSWLPLVEHFVQDWRCVMPDLPGHGCSGAAAPHLMSIAAMARQLQATMAAKSYEPSWLVAHSSGAAVATHWLLHYPHRVRGVVFISPALRPFRGVQGLVYPLAARTIAGLPYVADWLARRGGKAAAVERLLGGIGCRVNAEMVETYAQLFSQPEHMQGVLNMMAQWRLEELAPNLPEFDLPTLIVGGRTDQAVRPTDLHWLHSIWPFAQLEVLPGCGHLAHEEQPQTVVDLIRDWVGRLQQGAA